MLATFFDEGALVPVFTNLFVIGEAGEDIERPGPTSRNRVATASPLPSSASESSPPLTISSGAKAGAYSPRASRFAAEHNFNPAGDRRLRSRRPGARTAICVGRTKRGFGDVARRQSGLRADNRAPHARVAGVDGAVHAARLGGRHGARRAARAHQDGIRRSWPISRSTTWSRSARSGRCSDSPDLNAEFIDGRIVRTMRTYIWLSRCDTPRGLLAPVVRDAQRLSIGELAQAHEAAERQGRRRNHRAGRSVGRHLHRQQSRQLGIESFTPVINAPQVAILGVGAIQPKPVRRDGLVDRRRRPRPVAHLRPPGDRRRAGRALPADSPREDRTRGIGRPDADHYSEDLEACRSPSSSNRISVFAQRGHPVRRYSGERVRQDGRAGARRVHQGRPARHLAGHVRDSASSRPRSTRSRPRGPTKASPTTTPGPAHLSIGQEAAAVGMAFSLGPDDHIFGSHRSHGEILAKGFSAIRQLSDDELLEIMQSYRDGALLRPVEKATPARSKSWRSASSSTAPTARSSRAKPASIAGSAARCTPSSRRSASIRTTRSSAARARSRLARRSSSASTASPASSSRTSATRRSAAVRSGKGITFSAMDQYRKLWDASLGGGLPIIFNCMNNFYGMGGQPLGETMGVQSIARLGAGVNPEQMHAERVNGYDPLPVIDAFRRKRQVLQEGRGRSCSTRSPIASAATRRPTRRATGRRKRSSAGSRPIRSAPSASKLLDARRARRTTRSTSAKAEIEVDDPRHVAPRRRSRGQPARGGRFRAGRRGDVLEPARREVRRARAGIAAAARRTTRACSRFAARSARRHINGQPVPKMKASTSAMRSSKRCCTVSPSIPR